MSIFFAVLFRWVHVVSACVLLGGVFFMRVVLPAIDAAGGGDGQALLRARRVFKRVVHTCVLLLLLSGAYNAWANWPRYKLNPPVMHALFGTHVLLGVGVFVAAMAALAGAEPRKSYRRTLAVSLVLMLLGVGVASTLKWAREREVARRGDPAVPATQPIAQPLARE